MQLQKMSAFTKLGCTLENNSFATQKVPFLATGFFKVEELHFCRHLFQFPMNVLSLYNSMNFGQLNQNENNELCFGDWKKHKISRAGSGFPPRLARLAYSSVNI